MYESNYIIDTHEHFFDDKNLIKTSKELKESNKKYNISFSLVSFCMSERNDEKQIHDYYKALKFTLNFCKKNKNFGMLIWIMPKTRKNSKYLDDFIAKNREFIYGLKFHPYCSQIKMNDKKVEPYLKLAQKYDLPVLVHTADDEYSKASILKEVALKHKKVNFIAAHLDLYTNNIECLKYIRDIKNLYGDTAWVPIKSILIAKEYKILDKIMFGSDNPIDGIDTLNNDMYQKYYENTIHLSKENISLIMYKNAQRIYKISDEKLTKK